MSPPQVVFRQAAPCATAREHFSLFKHHTCAPATTVTTVAAPTYQAVMPIAIPQATYTYVPVQAMAMVPAPVMTVQAAPAASYQMAPVQAAPAMTYAAAPAPNYQMAPVAQAAPMMAYQAAPQVSYQMAPVQYMQPQPVQQVAMQMMAPVNAVPQAAPAAQMIPCIPQNSPAQTQAPPLAAQDQNSAAFLKSQREKLDAINAGIGKKTGTSSESNASDCCSQIEDLTQRVAVLKSLVERNTGILERHQEILKKNGMLQKPN